jgi:hypothetical protein
VPKKSKYQIERERLQSENDQLKQTLRQLEATSVPAWELALAKRLEQVWDNAFQTALYNINSQEIADQQSEDVTNPAEPDAIDRIFGGGFEDVFKAQVNEWTRERTQQWLADNSTDKPLTEEGAATRDRLIRQLARESNPLASRSEINRIVSEGNEPEINIFRRGE